MKVVVIMAFKMQRPLHWRNGKRSKWVVGGGADIRLIYDVLVSRVLEVQSIAVSTQLVRRACLTLSGRLV